MNGSRDFTPPPGKFVLFSAGGQNMSTPLTREPYEAAGTPGTARSAEMNMHIAAMRAMPPPVSVITPSRLSQMRVRFLKGVNLQRGRNVPRIFCASARQTGVGVEAAKQG
jgi:hypothetical protein